MSRAAQVRPRPFFYLVAMVHTTRATARLERPRMIATSDYSIMSLKALVTLTLKRDVDDEQTMHECAAALKGYLHKVARREKRRVCLLIDLRNCTAFTMVHVLTTVRILVSGVADLTDRVDASAVLVRLDARTERLRAAFETMYQATRPFKVCADDSDARAFLGAYLTTSEPPTSEPTSEPTTS